MHRNTYGRASASAPRQMGFFFADHVLKLVEKVAYHRSETGVRERAVNVPQFVLLLVYKYDMGLLRLSCWESRFDACLICASGLNDVIDCGTR